MEKNMSFLRAMIKQNALGFKVIWLISWMEKNMSL